MKRIAIYPGTFDPVTFGHIDLIKRATKLFDRIIVAVAMYPEKSVLFSFKERVEMLKIATRGIPRIRIETFAGLLVDYVKKEKSRVMIRGLRMISDFEYEFQMALMNRRLANEITTVFMMPHEKYTYLNSTIVKEVASLGGDISNFVPKVVEKAIMEKLREKEK